MRCWTTATNNERHGVCGSGSECAGDLLVALDQRWRRGVKGCVAGGTRACIRQGRGGGLMAELCAWILSLKAPLFFLGFMLAKWMV